MRFIEEVYESLCGELIDPIPGVEDAFEEGKPCERRYAEMLAAYDRLCERLNVEEEDPDVEIIIRSFFKIQKELCMKMYLYGVKFGIR